MKGETKLIVTVSVTDGVATTHLDLSQVNMSTYELIGLVEMIKQDLIKTSRERAIEKTKPVNP